MDAPQLLFTPTHLGLKGCTVYEHQAGRNVIKSANSAGEDLVPA